MGVQDCYKRLHIFDLDKSVADATEGWKKVVKNYLTENNCKFEPNELDNDMKHISVRSLFDTLSSKYLKGRVSKYDVQQDILSHSTEVYSTLPINEDAVRYMRYLKGNGCILGIVATVSESDLEAFITYNGLEGLFSFSKGALSNEDKVAAIDEYVKTCSTKELTTLYGYSASFLSECMLNGYPNTCTVGHRLNLPDIYGVKNFNEIVRNEYRVMVSRHIDTFKHLHEKNLKVIRDNPETIFKVTDVYCTQVPMTVRGDMEIFALPGFIAVGNRGELRGKAIKPEDLYYNSKIETIIDEIISR